ncbi:MAG TPA: GntP family permease [Methanoregula sp.]|nr:GntP family permease [Methanoregula sp.]
MDVFLVFFLTLLFLFILSYLQKLPVFVNLLLAAIFFGLLAGAGLDSTLLWVSSGMGSMVIGFGTAILSGIVIVQLLSDQGLLDVMVRGIRAKIKNIRAGSGIAAFILSVAVTCPVVTYAMLSPVLKRLEPEKIRANVLLYVTATSAIISYILIFPTPFTQPLASAFAPDVSGNVWNIATIPIALCLLFVVIAVSGRWSRTRFGKTGHADESGNVIRADRDSTGDPVIPLSRHLKAWAPFIAIVISIAAGLFLFGLSHVAILQFIPLTGLVVALLLCPHEIRMNSFSSGLKTAGPVIFDICAAGAIGTVVVKSGL